MKKDRKLVVQVSLIVSLMFILAITLISLVVSQGTKRMYIQSNNEQIMQELKVCRPLLMNPEIVGWVLDQWQADPEMVLGPFNAQEAEIYNSFIDSRFVAELETMENMEAMDEQTRRSYLKALYQFLTT